MPDMRLAERHARLRAHDDHEAVAVAHRFVLEYFGGDGLRAAWFFDELVNRTRVVGTEDTFFSVRTQTRRPVYLRTR